MANTFDERQQLVRAQTELQKRKLGGVFREAGRQGKTQLSRLRAQTGGAGGALVKAAGLQAKELARARGDVEAGIEAQGAAQQQSLLAEKQAQKFAREERLGGQEFMRGERLGTQEFQAGESRLTREQQAAQFERQMVEMGRQFDIEFDENQKTNFVNAAVALKEAGLKSSDQWKTLAGEFGILPQIYERSPRVTGGEFIGNRAGGLFPEGVLGESRFR